VTPTDVAGVVSLSSLRGPVPCGQSPRRAELADDERLVRECPFTGTVYMRGPAGQLLGLGVSTLPYCRQWQRRI
jgi:hypothetical protein